MMTEPTLPTTQRLYVPGMGMVPSSSTRRITALSSRSLVDNTIPKSKPVPLPANNDDANDVNDMLGYNTSTTTPHMQDLGYGDNDYDHHEEEELPSALDLGYGDDTPSSINIIAPATTNTSSRRRPRAVGAVQIRNGKRISPMLGPYANTRSSSSATSICSYSTDDYDDSSVDYSDDDDDDNSDCDEYEQDLTELTVDMGEDLLLDQNSTHNNPHMPSQVNMEFEGDSTSPRRISLAFNQHTQVDDDDGRSTTLTRTGCLEVSIGTSRLPRRRATMDHNQTENNGEIVRGLKKNHSNLSVSTRPMKRVSMEHGCLPTTTVVSSSSTTTAEANKFSSTTPSRITRPITRRITMNLCSSAPSFSRRLSGMSSGGTAAAGAELDRRQTQLLLPNRTLSGYSTSSGGRNPTTTGSSSFRRAGGRRLSTKTMECYSSPTVPLSTHATRKISMDMSPASPTSGGRRISMNLTKSILPREKPDSATTTTPPPKPIRRSTCCHARSA